MKTCYLCGKSDGHLIDCPKVGQIQLIQEPPSESKPTLSTIDQSVVPIYEPIIIVFKIGINLWRLDIIKYQGIIPYWATHGWCLDNKDMTVSNNGFSAPQLAKIWEYKLRDSSQITPGWRFDYGGITPNTRNIHVHELTVFGQVFDPKILKDQQAKC